MLYIVDLTKIKADADGNSTTTLKGYETFSEKKKKKPTCHSFLLFSTLSVRMAKNGLYCKGFNSVLSQLTSSKNNFFKTSFKKKICMLQDINMYV